MKFGELWLRELVNIPLSSEDLCKQITMAGLKVDNMELVSNSFSGVIVGEILECISQYLNNNKIYVVKVNIGNNRLLNVICNAPNCRRGLKVPVATIDAASPFSKNRAMIWQNIQSEGILCSYSELGISKNNNHIIELPDNAPVGIDISKYLKLNYDNIIEISVTSNRADCLSIIGIARDIAIFNNIRLNMPEIIPVTATINDILPIQIEAKATSACPRYLSRIIKDINTNAITPIWMKEKLRRCNIESVNTIADITNYVLIELGQPIYAFDRDCIDGGIIIRMAKEGEKLVLLNNREIKLNSDTLVIADYSKILEISGIFGGKNSGISYSTKNILLGCAYFNPLAIIGQSRRYGLYTNASYRYERGIDTAIQHKAIERATRLVIDIYGGEVGPIIDITDKEMLPKRTNITLRRNRLDNLIGHYITDTKINDILCYLGCEVLSKGKEQWQVIAPSWRFDIKIEEDLIEEVARIYGYNNIPKKPIRVDLKMNFHHEKNLSLERVKTLLNDRGYQEIITYSFVDPKIQKVIHPNEEMLNLINPISSKMSVMRLSLLPGIINTIIYNQNYQQNYMRIFETGLCFKPDTKADLYVRQDLMLGGAIYGSYYEEHWDLKDKLIDFYDIKGDLEAILDLTGKISEVEFCAKEIPALHLGQSAAIYLSDEYVGFIGTIHPDVKYRLGLNNNIAVFEIEWNKISNRIVPQLRDVSCFPANRRDIAIVVAEDIPAAAILAACRKVDSNRIVDVNLFDIYNGSGISKGYKSLTISLTIQDINCTLKEEEIADIVSKCIEELKKQFQASLRN